MVKAEWYEARSVSSSKVRTFDASGINELTIYGCLLTFAA
jgi:hypothetical protein